MEIDRTLAEDLAAAFEVEVDEVPCEMEGIVDFISDYVKNYIRSGGSILELMYRLQLISQRLHMMAAEMRQSFGL